MGMHTDNLGLKGTILHQFKLYSCDAVPGIAEACYLDAVAFKPQEAASIYNSLALLYSDAERNDDAITAYNASLQLEENVALYKSMPSLLLPLVTLLHVRQHGRAAAARRP